MIRLGVLLTLLLPSALDARGEGGWHLDLSLGSRSGDNLFLNAEEVGDTVLQGGVEIEKSFGHWTVSLVGTGDWLMNHSGMSSFAAGPGVSWLKGLGGRNAFQINAGFRWNGYGTDLALYGNGALWWSAQLKFSLSPTVLLRAGWSGTNRAYARMDSLDRLEQSWDVELSTFLPSQTTLILKGGLAHRHYPHLADSVQGETGMGEGRARGRWGGNRPAWQFSTQSHSLSLPMVVFGAGVSQALGTRVGLRVTAAWRHGLGSVDDRQDVLGALLREEPLRDTWSGEGPVGTVVLKAMPGPKWTVEIGGTLARRFFRGIPALDDQGAVLGDGRERDDTFRELVLDLGWHFHKMELSLRLGLSDNRSNDAWSSAHAWSVGAGLGVHL